MVYMKISLAVLTVLCIFKSYEATITEFTDDERMTLVNNVNELRATKGSSDMKKLCWTETMAERVRQAANNCDAVMQSDNSEYLMKVAVSSSSDVIGYIYSTMTNMISLKDEFLTDCEYTDDCGAGKMMLTSTVSEMYCVKATCSPDEYVYCGFPLSGPLMMVYMVYMQGPACDGCAPSDTCVDSLCVTEACMALGEAPTTTTTMMPVMEETPSKDDTMPMKQETPAYYNVDSISRGLTNLMMNTSSASTVEASYLFASLILFVLCAY